MFWDDKIVGLQSQVDTLTEANSEMGITIGRLIADRDFNKACADEYRNFWLEVKQERDDQELRALEAEFKRDEMRDAMQRLDAALTAQVRALGISSVTDGVLNARAAIISASLLDDESV